MSGELKRLTELEVRGLGLLSPDERVAFFRERGLIAPEPVDALALAIQHCFDDFKWGYTPEQVAITAKVAREWCNATAAPLTRERVREALKEWCPADWRWTATRIDALHAALTGAA